MSTGGVQARAYEFFRSKGLSHNATAGILASIKQESGFIPNRIGDGGLAHGLFQHHPDRRAAIARATGVNMSTAGVDDQLKGAWWEMNHGDAGAQRALRILQNPEISAHAAGGAFVQHFERPAKDERNSRGRMAEGIAGGKISRSTEYDDDYTSGSSRGSSRRSAIDPDEDPDPAPYSGSEDEPEEPSFADYLDEKPDPAPYDGSESDDSAPTSSSALGSSSSALADDPKLDTIEPTAFAKVRRSGTPRLAPFTAQASFTRQPALGLFINPDDVDDPGAR